MERILLILAVTGLVSCSGWNENWQVMGANDAYLKGSYQEALQIYLDLRALKVSTERMVYNIANVYRTLGENPSARTLWEKIRAQKDSELGYRTAFNLGNLYYERGMFQEAYKAFKEALIFFPQDTDAKRNLELSLLRFQSVMNTSLDSFPSPTASVRSSSRQETETLMAYIKRLEGNRWLSNSKENTAPKPNDW